jgi:hypothetical protein
VAGIVTNAASSVLCLLCRFPDPECSRRLCGSSPGFPLADPTLQVHEREDERWSVLEGDRRFRTASHASSPWQISHHRWPGRVTEARPGHVPPGTRRRTAVHPILVGLTESHDQHKAWLAWRSAVDL